jgi:hypothetical protein
MDNYDIVVEKTVKDLFKSSTLVQIKKYKQTKENAIIKKEEELKKLILEKYPILIDSINSLQQISLNLNDLKEIRKNFRNNITRLEKFEFNAKSNLKINDLMEDGEDVQADLAHFDIEGEFDNCYDLLNSGEFEELILKMINLKKAENLDEYKFDTILVELMEVIMKKFFDESLVIEANEVRFYIFSFFSIFHLINDINMLNFIQFYLKLKSDENVEEIFTKIFKENSEWENCDSAEAEALKESLIILIKLTLLKISKNLSDLNTNNTTSESNYISLYTNIAFIINLVIKLTNNNLIQSDSEEDEEATVLRSSSQKLNKTQINFSDILNYIQTIYSLDDIKVLKFKHSCVNDFIEFVKGETFKLTFSSLDVTKILLFAYNIFNKINNLYLDAEVKEHRLFDILFAENLLNTILKLIDDEFKKFNNPGIDIHDIRINQFIKELTSLTRNSLVNNIEKLFVKSFKEFLSNRAKDILFTNKIVIYLFERETKAAFLSLNDDFIKQEFEELSKEYIQNQYKMLDDYMNEIKDLLTLENYEENITNEDGVGLFTSSLAELAGFLHHHYKFYSIDIGEIETLSIKQKLLNIIIVNYTQFYNNNNKQKLYNKKIVNDLTLLTKISKEIFKQRQENNDIPSNINIDLNSNSHKLNSFFTREAEEFLKPNAEGSCSHTDLTFWSTPSFKGREQIPFDKRLNTYILGYKKAKIENKQLINLNSTKLLEFKIDTNYLSLKSNEKTNTAQGVGIKREPQGHNKTNSIDNTQPFGDVKSYFSYFGDKLKQNINNISSYVNKDN